MKAIIGSRNFLTLLLVIGGILFSVCKANAQSDEMKKSPEERAQRISDKMKTELSLSDEQYEKVKAINLKYAQKNDEILKSSSGKLARFRSLKSSQDKKKKEMKAVLDKEQYEKYEKMMKDLETEAKNRYNNQNG